MLRGLGVLKIIFYRFNTKIFTCCVCSILHWIECYNIIVQDLYKAEYCAVEQGLSWVNGSNDVRVCFYEVPRISILMHIEFKVDSMKIGSLFHDTIILLKSVHFKNTVARSSVHSKILSFSIKYISWPFFDSADVLLKMIIILSELRIAQLSS